MSGREQVQQVYIRVCRDSGFRLDWVSAAALTGKILAISPLEVWLAMPHLDTMLEIATGEHPAAQTPTPARSLYREDR